MRAVARSTSLQVSVNGVYLMYSEDTAIAAGQGGVGARGTPAGNTIGEVKLGPLDRTPPPPVDAQTIATSVFPTCVHLEWQGVDDGPNGVGVQHYFFLRDGAYLAATTSGAISDCAVSPTTTYTYTIAAQDVHNNWSPETRIQITTPMAGAVDPRRIGVRATGAYWGAGAEQIDMLSGNLNYTLPLVKAMGRGGWGVGFSLNYNSQLWRYDSGRTWKLGRDVGFGFGWKLLAGSITPSWADALTLHHFVYTDASGAAYRLDVNTNNVWTSREGIYLAYDANTHRLYFPDGSFWAMGAVAAAAEPDALPDVDRGQQRVPLIVNSS